MVLGDFNAHLGIFGGVRGVGSLNLQGILVGDLMARCNLNAVSLGSLASGLDYTYISGDTLLVTDYVFADIGATTLVSSCHTLDMEEHQIISQ